MKLTNRMTLTACLLLISGVAFGHSGHEALGDGVHFEYFLAAGAAVAIGIYALMRHKRDRQD
ncbi:hypothetical protein SAMN04487880_0155 [Marinobacter sp. es.042]|uniref:hypothetical protein n=1 Tax=Marinobacter sp. es.042 TaxID=1761794 RepID=UPI000B50B75B|nr:hypothetical protein [Marinobacter sp. es.042]SNB54136.1 hypothetical protein SAMN04487880_0155 [Marinobacter sp. es.042]